MRRIIVLVLFCSTVLQAAPKKIPLAVAQMNGFNDYLTAALKKQGIPTSIVASQSRYALVNSTYVHWRWLSLPGGHTTCEKDVCPIVSGSVAKRVAALMIVDRQSLKTVWARQLPNMDWISTDVEKQIAEHCAADIARFLAGHPG
jgi:hypothetical protein